MIEVTLATPLGPNSSGAAMTLSLPLDEENEYFDQLANRLARELATGFGYSLEEAEKHLSEFYLAYDKKRPGGWTAADYFNHDDSAVVLRLGYELAGGNSSSLEFIDWRKGCWEPLRNGERVPAPPK
jgi:hypothetical protein